MVVLFNVIVFCILAALVLTITWEIKESRQREFLMGHIAKIPHQPVFPTVIQWAEGISLPPVVGVPARPGAIPAIQADEEPARAAAPEAAAPWQVAEEQWEPGWQVVRVQVAKIIENPAKRMALADLVREAVLALAR